MNLTAKLLIALQFTGMSLQAFSQQQSLDVLSFTVPKNWQQVKTDGGIQLSVTNKTTGAYAIAIVTKTKSSTAAAADNFNNDWNTLVRNAVQVKEEPTMQAPTQENGWDLLSGGSKYTDNGSTGAVTLLTATAGSQTVSVVLFTNTTNYQEELAAFLNSLQLAKASEEAVTNAPNSPATTTPGTTSIVGLWTNYVLETTGYYINGSPQYTAGYLRKEYTFYSDGTYLFRNKQWLTKAPDITFIYETGTYAVQGNQLTLTPKTGKGGFWTKKASTKEWGSFKKSSDYKLEKTTYTFKIILDPTYGNSIQLTATKPTARDGGQFNAPDDPYEFRYSDRRGQASLVDNPPGLKTGFENKK